MKVHEIKYHHSEALVMFIPGINGSFENLTEIIGSVNFEGDIVALDWDRKFQFDPVLDFANPVSLGYSLNNYLESYLNICRNADRAGKELVTYEPLNNYSKVYLLAHSMGTRAAYTFLSGLNSCNPVSQILLFNGAAPNSNSTFPFQEKANNSKVQIQNFFNENDPVLSILGKNLSKAEEIPLFGDVLKATGFFRPIGLGKTLSIDKNQDIFLQQGYDHRFSKALGSIRFDDNFFTTYTHKDNMKYSSIFDEEETQSATSNQGENRNQLVKAMDERANSLIMKYSMMAGVSGSIPLIPEAVTDSIVQLQLLNELKTTYQFDSTFSSKAMTMFASVVDNLASKHVIKTLTQLLHGIPVIGNFLAVSISYILDFAYTYIIGYVFKSIFRTAYLKKLNRLDTQNIGSLISEAIRSSISFIKENWKLLLMGRKRVIERYELDMNALNKEFEATIHAYSDLFKQSAINLHAIKAEIGNLSNQSDDIETLFLQLAKEMKQPSIDLLIADARLKLMRGETINPILQAMIDIEDSQRFANKLLKDHN